MAISAELLNRLQTLYIAGEMIKSETMAAKTWTISHGFADIYAMRLLSFFVIFTWLFCLLVVHKFTKGKCIVYIGKKTFMTATENKWSNIWKMGHFQAHQFKELFMLRVRVRVRVICVYCIQTCKYIDIDMLSVQHETRLIPMETYLICMH